MEFVYSGYMMAVVAFVAGVAVGALYERKYSKK